ncbi:MAG: aldehyde dehydrogenase family protein [Saprospiraceae bacterium]|nr:aldehyde dehydrogenase family protein [Saprospiraceae bacterium]
MTASTHHMIQETPKEEINRIFEIQKSNQFEVANTTVKQRIAKLKKLHKAVLKYRSAIKEAMYNDFKKHPSEVDLIEIYPVTSEIKHTISHLRQWMDKHEVSTPLALMGSSSYVHYEPKGVVLIISPWNFPINLTFAPLVSAIAAGNTVILKPSEHTAHSAAIMHTIVEEVFDPKEVALVQGGIQTAQNLLALPFNHIFFTGAPSIGKIVMTAAAKHLTSVTLELGGKSPTIVDQTADIDMAARRTAWGKFLNTGQICIAPDYIFVHESKKKAFLESLKKYLKAFYGDDPSKEGSYARMVNSSHCTRVKNYIDQAREQGAEIVYGGETDEASAYISPTILTNVPMDSDVMKEEVFGPVLPVHGFTDLEEVLKEINAREKPLALYIYSKNKSTQNYIIQNTRAGGTCINHNGVHFYNANLPFGGSNNSGIGKSHGWYGFEAFSNPRAILKQHLPNALEKLMPPYNDFKQKLIDLTIKWF